MPTRRTFIKDTATLSAYGLLLSQLAGCKAGQKLTIPDTAPYKMDFVRGSVGFFTERGGTIGWMAHKDGLVVVDTQFPEQSEHLIGELQNSPIDVLINTHHHGDSLDASDYYAIGLHKCLPASEVQNLSSNDVPDLITAESSAAVSQPTVLHLPQRLVLAVEQYTLLY